MIRLIISDKIKKRNDKIEMSISLRKSSDANCSLSQLQTMDIATNFGDEYKYNQEDEDDDDYFVPQLCFPDHYNSKRNNVCYPPG